MASNESIFEKLNLSSGERRLVMIVIVVLMLALVWMVWGMIPDPGATRNEIAKAQTQLNSFTNEISQITDYEKEIRKLEGMGSAVVPIEQEVNMRRAINNLTAANGVKVTRTGRMTTKTNDFFLEKSMRIDFSSKESDIVKFLWKLGGSDSMVRVSEMRIQPDKNRYRLDGWMNLTASYQKDVKATKPKPATEAKAKPVAAKPAAKPEPAKPKAETKPASSKPKTEGGKRKVTTKRKVPGRTVRKTQ
jgi:Tfp pilus assembly protein PilO